MNVIQYYTHISPVFTIKTDPLFKLLVKNPLTRKIRLKQVCSHYSIFWLGIMWSDLFRTNAYEFLITDAPMIYKICVVYEQNEDQVFYALRRLPKADKRYFQTTL